MGLLAYRLRVFFRSHFKPINQSVAERWQKTLNWIYIFSAWSAFGLMVYYYYHKPNVEKDENYRTVISAHTIAKRFGRENVAVVHIKGFNDVSKEVLAEDGTFKKQTK